MDNQSSHESVKRYAEHQVVELIRTIAWEDLSLEVNGDSIRELVLDIYAAGGHDGVAGMLAIMHTAPNVPVQMVHLYAQAEAGASRRADAGRETSPGDNLSGGLRPPD